MIDFTIPDDMIDRQFFATLAREGITPMEELRPLDASGDIVRFAVDGDRHGATSGAYFLHGDGLPNWGVMDFRRHDGMICDTFRFDRMTALEQSRLRQISRQSGNFTPCPPSPSPRSRRTGQDRIHRLHAMLARYREGLSGSLVATHPFVRRRFTEHGIRLTDIDGFNLWGTGQLADNAPRTDHTGALLWPLLHVGTGRFCGLQWYGTRQKDGGSWAKGFMSGTSPLGASVRLAPIGARDGTVYVCEGIATGLAVLALLWAQHRITVIVHCALTAHNIPTVCEQLRGVTDAQIVIAADNDAATAARTGTNTGLAAAQATKNAALADKILVPDFARASKAPQNVDWYDVLIRSCS